MLAEQFKGHYGTEEYTGVVVDIQKWFYGSLVRASWCATSLCYFMEQLGKLALVGGKNENVYHMMNACRTYAMSHNDVQFFDKDHIPEKLMKDDILFWLWSGKMCVTGDKHVGVCAEDCVGDLVPCIGGNQKDMICTQQYPKAKLYAVYRWAPKPAYTLGWNKDNYGWWYADKTDHYLANCWKVINRHWYYFGADGYMLTGLQHIDGKLCYLTESGPYEGALMRTDNDGYLSIWEV